MRMDLTNQHQPFVDREVGNLVYDLGGNHQLVGLFDQFSTAQNNDVGYFGCTASAVAEPKRNAFVPRYAVSRHFPQ